MKAMGDSTGALSTAYAKYYDSIQARVDSFKASFQSLSQAVVNADLAKGLVGGAAAFLDVLTQIISALDSIGGIVPMLVGIVSSVFVSALPKIIAGLSGLPNIITGFINLFNAFRLIGPILNGATGTGIIALLSNPATIGAIAASVAVLGFGISAVVKHIQDAHPSLSELKQDVAELESQISSIGSEMEKNQDRIEELNNLKAAGGISEAEEVELSYLQQQNELLDAQIKLREQLANEKRGVISDQTSQKAAEWANTPQQSSKFYWDMYGGTWATTPNYEGLGGLLNAVESYKSARDEFFTASNEKRYEDANAAQALMLSALDDIERLSDEAFDLRSELSGSTDPIDIDTLQKINTVLKLVGETLGRVDGKYSDFKTDVAETFDEDQNASAKNALEILREYAETTEITAESVAELAEKNADLKAWMDETGYSAEDVAVYFNRMRSEVDDTSESVDELSNDVTNLSHELQQAANDLKNYSDSTSGEKGDTADKYGSAYKKFLEDWNSGKTGTNAVRAAIELFIPEDTLRDLDYDLTSAGELLASDMYQAIFNTDGDYGENFANYIKDNFERFKDVASIIDNGDGTFDFSYDSLSGLAEAFGLSENAVTALLDCLDKYGVQAMMSAEETRQLATDLNLIGPNSDAAASNVERVMTAITGLAQQGKSGTEIKTLLNSLESAGYIDLSGVEGLGDAIADAIAAVQGVGDENATFEITATDSASPVIEGALATLHGAEGESATLTIKANDDEVQPSVDDANAAIEGVEDKTAIIDVDNSGAISGAAAAQAAIDSVTGKTVSINVESGGGGDSGHSHHGGHFATGTKNAPGGPALVNELGPELISDNGQAYIAGGGKPAIVNLSPHAIVLDAQDTKNALSGTSRKLFKGVPINAYARVNKPIAVTDSGTGNKPSGLLELATRAAAAAAATVASKNGANKKSGGGGGGGGNSSDSKDKEETWFEKQLAEHKHLVEMDKESQKDYLDWLDKAYKKAYKEEIIDLKEYRQHEEEVYKGRQNDFKDHLNDTEHLIELEKNGENNPTTIYNLYVKMMGDIDKELKKCYDSGLDSTNEYVQYLQNSWNKYNKEIQQQQEEANDAAKKQVKDLVDYRIKMLKQYLKNEIQSLKDRLSNLKDFYSKQKELLQDARDEENYLDDQAEKRKAVTDIQAELRQLENDTSAWAQKRKLKLQEELADAQKTLDDFEKDHALKVAQDQIDAIAESQEKAINAEIDGLQAKLDDPKYLYETALKDVQNNSVALYEEMIEFNNKYGTGIKQDIVDMWEEAYVSLKRYHDLYGQYYNGINLVNATGLVEAKATKKVSVKKGYASGTSFATPGLHRIDELGAEAVFTSKDGNRYRMLSAGDKVLTADATSFLYNFAENGRRILAQLFGGGSIGNLGLVGAGGGICEIRTGDIIIQGNADERTVSEIRRAQRDGVNTILKELKRLKK